LNSYIGNKRFAEASGVILFSAHERKHNSRSIDNFCWDPSFVLGRQKTVYAEGSWRAAAVLELPAGFDQYCAGAARSNFGGGVDSGRAVVGISCAYELSGYITNNRPLRNLNLQDFSSFKILVLSTVLFYWLTQAPGY
jgi:hypothetical protein